jgi:uncharacterized membrane protein YfcA
MSILLFSILAGAGAVVAGLLGALSGLGGGVIIVPFLTLALGVDIRYAIGASLVSVIATSSGAAIAYIKDGYSNVRLGMFLEVATTLGALLGAHLASVLPVNVISVIFGLVLLPSAYFAIRFHRREALSTYQDAWSAQLHLDGTYPSHGKLKPYRVQHVPLGFGLMSIAGAISGLLGIGSGEFKVLAMDQAMQLPFKVSTATSNFMIGVTAAASAGVYLNHGYVSPSITMPVVVGVLIGSFLGARAIQHFRTRLLRVLFALLMAGVAVEMIHKGIMGGL